jgi:hypothetical protein
MMSYTEFLYKKAALSVMLHDHRLVILRVTDPAYTQLSPNGLSLLRRQERELESQLEGLYASWLALNKVYEDSNK